MKEAQCNKGCSISNCAIAATKCLFYRVEAGDKDSAARSSYKRTEELAPNVDSSIWRFSGAESGQWRVESGEWRRAGVRFSVIVTRSVRLFVPKSHGQLHEATAFLRDPGTGGIRTPYFKNT